MKGSIGIFIIIAILVIIFLGILFSKGYVNRSKSPSPSPSYASLSEDPKYKDVKEKYGLNEEQLRILSTVDPNDNE